MEKVAHQEDVHLLDVFHLDGVDAVNLCDQTLWVVLEVVQVERKGVLEDALLMCVHRLDYEPFVEGAEHEGATLTSRLLCLEELL